MVALAVLLDGVLGGERDARHDDHHHDERLEEGERHDAVDKDADGVRRRQQEHGRVRQDGLLHEHVVVVRGAAVAELHLAARNVNKL